MKKITFILLILPFACLAKKAPDNQAQVDSLQRVISKASHDSIVVKSLAVWDEIVDEEPSFHLGLNSKIDSICGLNLSKGIAGQEKSLFLVCQAQALANMGKIHKSEYNYERALSLFSRSLEMAEEMGRRDNVVNNLEEIGSIYYIKGNYDLAKESFEKGLEVAKEIGDKPGMARMLYWVGRIFRNRGHYDVGKEYYEKSLEIWQEVGDKKGMARALYGIGVYYRDKGDHDKTLEYHGRCLKLMEEEGDERKVASFLNSIANIHRTKGDYSKAMELYSKSMKINEKLGSKSGLAGNYYSIGVVYRNQGDYDMAMEYYNKVLKIRQESGDKKAIGSTLNSIGMVCFKQGEYDKAMDYYLRSLKIKEELGYRKGMANTLDNIGEVHFVRKEYGKARASFFEVLRISNDLGFIKGKAGALSRLGAIYYEEGNYAKANDYTARGLRLAQQSSEADIARDASGVLWQSLKKSGRYQESLEVYERHIATKDSINSERVKREVIHQELKYAFEKKEELARAEQLRKEELSQVESEQKNYIIGTTLTGLVLVLAFAFFVVNRLRIAKEQKTIIEWQKAEVEQQKAEIEKAHRKITDSLNYAKRLQVAILPSVDEMSKHLPNHFILFKPKDVVSGDFYWFEQLDGTSYLAAADCTGHGVPGAMVSVVCSSALNRSVKEFGITDPSRILNKTRELVIETFAKSGEDVQDGMDIALCAFNEKKVIFSGANNPLWIVRKTEMLTEKQKSMKGTLSSGGLSIIEHKADRQPIGVYASMKDFTQQEIDICPDDSLYFFTDGFPDQFGGEKGKKFKHRPFKHLLIDMHEKSMDEQAQYISAAFDDWKGDLEQTDDVCVIGIRANISA